MKKKNEEKEENNKNYFYEQEVHKKLYTTIKLPSLYELYPYFLDEDEAINYLLNMNILRKYEKCPKCNNKVHYENKQKRYHCSWYQCKKSLSIFQNTIFYKAKLPINKILFLLYEFLKKTSRDSAAVTVGVTPFTATFYYKKFREQLSIYAVDNIKNNLIGGKNETVEIDESYFCKRKYNKGHHVNGIWVLGGIQRGTKKIFTIPVEERNKETLLYQIKKFVKPETRIITDFWKGYINLKDNNYIHDKVNHKKCFKVKGTDNHTNTIEGIWNGLKMNIIPQHRTRKYLFEHLLEQQWRINNKHKNL
ncbi:hypothetical protein INT45_008086 [Circinella minor]|uniref:ISXO2-like transposase domain-containing protein n=1 Tax=Circinella minor TaxID=1195481 RepID=A0A8H7RXH3_9FUNG|nr:hypothetical protein INT45_008086 [Circinella minor]